MNGPIKLLFSIIKLMDLLCVETGCARLNNDHPKYQVLIFGTVSVTLHDDVFADVIKLRSDMERLTWINQVGTKCDHMYPRQREAGDSIQTHRGESHVKMEQRETQSCSPWQLE